MKMRFKNNLELIFGHCHLHTPFLLLNAQPTNMTSLAHVNHYSPAPKSAHLSWLSWNSRKEKCRTVNPSQAFPLPLVFHPQVAAMSRIWQSNSESPSDPDSGVHSIDCNIHLVFFSSPFLARNSMTVTIQSELHTFIVVPLLPSVRNLAHVMCALFGMGWCNSIFLSVSSPFPLFTCPSLIM